MLMRYARWLSPLLVSLVLLASCVAEKPNRLPAKAPKDLQVRLVTIAVHDLIDSDSNGYPDTLPLIIYFWDNRYPLPIWADGSIHFTLTDESGMVIAQWDVPEEVLQASRRRDQVGAVHVLTLDIRQATTDELPLTKATLSAVFTPSDGGPVGKTARPMAVRIGR